MDSKVTSAFVTCFLLTSAVSILVASSPVAVASGGTGWWDPGWQYRKPVTVANGGASTLTDYQVLLVVDTSELVSAGKMRSDAGDMRFTDASATELPYWIESGANTASTKVWVRVPSVPASGTATIYMYYGNPGAASASNPDSTFLLFDSFDGTAIDTAKWTVVGSGISQNDVLVLGTSSGWGHDGIYTNGNFARGTALEFRARVTSYGNITGDMFGFKDNTLSVAFTCLVAAFEWEHSSTWYYTLDAIESGNYSRSQRNGWSVNTWYSYEIVAKSSGNRYYRDGALFSETTTSTASPLKIGASSSGAMTVEIDDVILRRYADPEPTASVGTEETSKVLATVDIDPDTLNRKSNGKWITAYIELPAGYDVANIDVGTVKLQETVAAERQPTTTGDYDRDGIQDLMVKFSRSAVQALAQPGTVGLTVTGEVGSAFFEGSDTVRVI